MPRPLRPPRGVFAPTNLLFDTELPDAVKATALQLRALGWNQDETPALSMPQLCQELGKSQATLYGHMRLLRLRGALRWRSAGSTEIIVSFEPVFWDSKKLEKPVKDLEESHTQTQKQRQTFQLSKKLESNENPGVGTQAIKDAYVGLLGYKPDNWAAGEGTAAKAIGETYTVAQLEEAYRHYKSQPFWKDKRLYLRYLRQQMPEFFQNGKQSASAPAFKARTVYE